MFVSDQTITTKIRTMSFYRYIESEETPVFESKLINDFMKKRPSFEKNIEVIDVVFTDTDGAIFRGELGPEIEINYEYDFRGIRRLTKKYSSIRISYFSLMEFIYSNTQ